MVGFRVSGNLKADGNHWKPEIFLAVLLMKALPTSTCILKTRTKTIRRHLLTHHKARHDSETLRLKNTRIVDSKIIKSPTPKLQRTTHWHVVRQMG